MELFGPFTEVRVLQTPCWGPCYSMIGCCCCLLEPPQFVLWTSNQPTNHGRRDWLQLGCGIHVWGWCHSRRALLMSTLSRLSLYGKAERKNMNKCSGKMEPSWRFACLSEDPTVQPRTVIQLLELLAKIITIMIIIDYVQEACVCARQQVLPAKECAMRFKTDWTRKLYQDIPRICGVFWVRFSLKMFIAEWKTENDAMPYHLVI